MLLGCFFSSGTSSTIFHWHPILLKSRWLLIEFTRQCSRMCCPAVLWLSRTDVSCDKCSCCCHPGRADTLHTLQATGVPLSIPLLVGTTAVPKWIVDEGICQGLFAAGPDLMLLLLQMERPVQSVGDESCWWTIHASGPAWWHQSKVWTNKKLKSMRGQSKFQFLCVSP